MEQGFDGKTGLREYINMRRVIEVDIRGRIITPIKV